MHDTAFRIGSLAMNIYADLGKASVLEIGSKAFNGGLRDNALPTTNYVGIDLEDGEGVDLVVEAGKPLPVDDDAFDLVIASSVFEHDPMFWMTFLEMCRKTKEGGFIYINAPSNGFVHRFPQDNWRFYPDSAKALVDWAVTQGQHVSLVESFIADREDDIWNDFVAVFRKGRITKTLPKVFIHEHVPCYNVKTWKSAEILNRRDEPEDMVLIAEARARVQEIEQSLASAIHDRDEAGRQLAHLSEQRAALEKELEGARQAVQGIEGIRNDLASRESELRQRQEEIEQTRRELAQSRKERDDMAARVTESEAGVARLSKELEEVESRASQVKIETERRASAEANADRWKQLCDQQLRQTVELRDGFERARKEQEQMTADRLAKNQAVMEEQLREVRDKVTEAEARAREQEAQVRLRFQEITTLTTLLRQQEQQGDQALAHLDWLRAVSERLRNMPRWWNLLPKPQRKLREQECLSRSGLFDSAAYLARYPDVAAAGIDPLQHYLLHGLHEGRSR